jgi:hypothetical protein
VSIKQFRGFLALNRFGRFFYFRLLPDSLMFCEDILLYLNITNLPIMDRHQSKSVPDPELIDAGPARLIRKSFLLSRHWLVGN